MITPIAKSKPLEDLLIEELRLIFDSEMQKVDVLWEMAEAAEAPEVNRTFTKLWGETLDNINGLEEIFILLESYPHERDSEKVNRQDADVTIQKGRNGSHSDEALLDQADRMWLHEIAGYLKARTYAALLGYARVTDILQKILEEEQETERLIAQLTQRLVRGSAEFEPPPIEFPGFGFRQLQTRLKDPSRPSQFGKDGS